jgi:hypothetical protein
MGSCWILQSRGSVEATDSRKRPLATRLTMVSLGFWG